MTLLKTNYSARIIKMKLNKGIYSVTSSNKCCYYEICIHQWIMLFLEQQISILECFLKDHVTLKTGVMTLKIQLCHHRNPFDPRTPQISPRKAHREAWGVCTDWHCHTREIKQTGWEQNGTISSSQSAVLWRASMHHRSITEREEKE